MYATTTARGSFFLRFRDAESDFGTVRCGYEGAFFFGGREACEDVSERDAIWWRRGREKGLVEVEWWEV